MAFLYHISSFLGYLKQHTAINAAPRRNNLLFWTGHVGSSLSNSLRFHLPPPFNSLPILPQARVSLLLLLFHLLLYDHPLFPCCGPTCHVKKHLCGKSCSTGKRGLRTELSCWVVTHALTLLLFLWWKHFCFTLHYTFAPSALQWVHSNRIGTRARSVFLYSNKWLKACSFLWNILKDVFLQS